MKLTSLLILASLIAMFGGCALTNPFIPPHGTQEVIYETSSYPTEPIKSKNMYRATMKPYRVDGVEYCPIVPHIGQTFTGVASWYGPNFHGNKTSNGEYYDMQAATAAHKTLPINTLVQVTNLDNGLSTIVRINDRGPFVKNRIIDLSRQAALDIDMIKKGTARVKLEVIDFDKTAISYCHKPSPQKEQITPITEAQPDQNRPFVYKVQIVSTQDRAKANALVQKYAIMDGKYKASIKTKTFWQRTYYKVQIGDFHTADEAQNFIASHYFDGAFVVKD